MARSPRDIAGYRLLAGLGEGGMARVYLALSRKAAGFSKLVVLKVLRSSVAADPEMRRMFLDEARVAALLSHPNVVQTYEAGEDEGRLFLAMEYLEGKALSAIVASSQPDDIPLDVHLRIIADMLEGLHYAHGLGDIDGTPLHIVHRDVSPHNVLVTYSGETKVVDFGIAKIAGSPATQSGVIKGKVGYMAPEQIHNKDVDHRADVFAAGVMMWEAIAKRRLMRRGEDEVVVLARRMVGEDASVRTVAPAGTPETLLAICDKAMSAKPEARFASALELHSAIDGYLRSTGGADRKGVAELLEKLFGEKRKAGRAFIEEQMRVAEDSAMLSHIEGKKPMAVPSLTPFEPNRAHSAPDLPLVEPRPSTTAAAHVADAMPRPPTKAPPLVAFAGFLLLGTIGAVAMASALGSRSAERAAPSASTRAAASLVQNAAPVDPGTGDPPPIGEPTTTVPSTSAATEMIPTPLATAAVRVDGGIARDKNKGSRNKRPIDDGDPYRR